MASARSGEETTDIVLSFLIANTHHSSVKKTSSQFAAEEVFCY